MIEIAQWPSIRDVCGQLNVTQPYVYRLLMRGKMRFVRTRVGILVDPESVAQFVANRKPPRRIA
ncbi:MAG TPA: excisionase family DNA-binding protein [Ktedonobacterales bacterium]